MASAVWLGELGHRFFMSHKMAISWLLYDILTIVYYGRIYIGYICINWPMGFIKKDLLWLPLANINGYNRIYIGNIWLYMAI